MEESNLEAAEAGPSTESEASTSHSQQEQRCMIAQEETEQQTIQEDPTTNKSHVDTAALKGAVSKFGGIRLDWKEKQRKQQDQDQDDEVGKVQQEAAEYHDRSTAAQAGRAQALRELGSATRAADKLRLSLKRSQIEEAQARHESDLADRRLRDLQRGAPSSQTAQADVDDATERRAAALAELQAARAEVESLAKVRAAAAAEAGAAEARARDAAAEARETGKAVEALAGELVALKADMESSHAAHVEAEERRLRLALALEQDKSQWQMELEDAQHEAKSLRAHLMAACDVDMKAEAASQVMAELLKAADLLSPTRMMLRLEKMRKELADVRAGVERARGEAECFRAAAASMRDELEREKAELAALRRREGLSSATIPYLKDELIRATAELAAAEATKRTAEEQVGEARREAEEAKAKARSAGEEVGRAREDAGVAKAAVAAVEARLEAVARETLAATTSEEIAAASAAALLQQLELKLKLKASAEAGCVTLSAAEYGELSRRARETEEAGGRRVMEAVKLIKEAKDAEVRMLERLAKQERYTEQRRQALEAATLEAEEAEFAKLSADRELRQWLADHDSPSPRAGLAEISVLHDRPGAGSDNPHILSPRGGYMMQPRTTEQVIASEAEARQRKATFFPRMVMFLARKRAQSWK
ncbi:unnamed protein product [Urochloa decumbens]|uniref:Uncharacterized protein n=1 Tax=Urochloa decumbens TaxID=240449 RepID=A0ABC8Y306_9POAL